MNNIFSERSSGKKNLRLKKIVQLWLTRRIIFHKYNVLESKIFGKESLIINRPELEYRAIFESVARLKYNVKVNVNNISFFESSGINTIDDNYNYMGHGIDYNCTNRSMNKSREFDNDFFSIPIKMLNGVEIKIVNTWVRSKSFKHINVSKKSRFFCTYESIDKDIDSTDFNTWRNVHIKYKEAILSVILNELMEQIIADSLRFSHIVYSKKFDINRISMINSRKQVDFIINTRFYIIYRILSIICKQLEIVLNETIGYNNIKNLDDILSNQRRLYNQKGSGHNNNPRVNTDEYSKVILAEIFKNYIKSFKFIVIAFESRINFKQNE